MTETKEIAKFALLESFKVKDLEYNRLSEETRQKLEALVPKAGQVFIRRTEAPYIVPDMQTTDASGKATSQRYTARLYGHLGVPPELSIQDPFDGRITKIINVRQIDGNGQPEPVLAEFNKNNEFLMLDMSNSLERQTLGMLYLNPEFEQCILRDRNGKTVRYARVDQTALVQNEVDARVSIAEMIVKLKNMDADHKKLLAQTMGFDTKGNVLGDGYIDGFLQNCIDARPMELESAFKILHIVEVENMIRKACEYGLLIYNIGESCFSYNNKKAQVMVYFGKNVDNQYRHAAQVLLNEDLENKAHMKFLKELVEKHEETIRQNVRKNMEGVLAPGELRQIPLEELAEKHAKRMAGRHAHVVDKAAAKEGSEVDEEDFEELV